MARGTEAGALPKPSLGNIIRPCLKKKMDRQIGRKRLHLCSLTPNPTAIEAQNRKLLFPLH